MALEYALNYIASPTCADFMNSRDRHKILAGPVGGGKTSAAITHMLYNSINQEPDNDGVRRTRHLVVRNTVPMLRQTTIKSFLDWIPDGVFGKWLTSDKTYYMKFDDVEAEVLFMSLEDANDIRKLLSLETTTAFFNEFREINPDIVEGLIGTKRVGRYPSRKQGPGATYPCIIADTNMPSMGSWHQQAMDGIVGDWTLFKQPSGRSAEAENLQFLPPGYYDTSGLNDEYIKTMIDCEYGTSREGLPVFRSTFIPAFHIATEPLKPIISDEHPLIIGVDAGLTPAAIIGQVTPRGNLNILAECWTPSENSMGMERFLDTRLIPLLRSRFAGHKAKVIVDPASMQRSQATEETVFEIIAKKRMAVIPAPSNKIDLRVGSAEMLFAKQVDGKAYLLIDASCKGLIAALKYGYKYGAKRDGDIDEKPLKNHPDSDICFVAGTRVATPAGDTPIEELKEGDLVVTPDGPCPVLFAGMSAAYAEVWLWEFSDGSSFGATPAHPVYVNAEKGFVPLDTLTYHDILEGIYYDKDVTWERSTSSGLTENGSLGTPGTTTTGTSNPVTGKSEVFPCTATFGNTITAPYQRGGSSTTKITTLPTTPPITLNSVYTANTNVSTCRSDSQMVVTGARDLPLRVSRLLSGMGLQKVWNGISATVRSLGRGSSRILGFVRGVVRRMKALEGPEQKTSAPPTAVRRNEKPAESTMPHGRVVYAAPSLSVTSTLRKKRAVTLVRKSKCPAPSAVYALRVADCPMYYASGILVKNCDAFTYLTVHLGGEVRIMSSEKREIKKANHAGWT